MIINTLIAILIFWCGSALSDQSSKIDRTFTKHGDVTGDGESETLTVHITSMSIETPFKWSFIISDLNGATIYRVDRDDTWLDNFFKDNGYVIRCTDYTSCKERYYFNNIPIAIFASLKPSIKGWVLNKYTKSNLHNTASAYLTKQGISAENITVTIEEMRKILQKPGFHNINVPISPVKSSAPMIWVPNIKEFVPYYQE
jgi:hypothetical protein